MKQLSLKPNPDMQWIYDPKFRDDPQAKHLRERREVACRSAPEWMIREAYFNDALKDKP